MAAPDDFLLTDPDDQRPVQRQCLDRGAAGRSASKNQHPPPAEVLVPAVTARMEERNLLATGGIDGCLTSCLAQGAGNTSQGKIAGRIRSSGLHRHHVVDMKGRFLTLLGEATVLASVTGSPDKEPAQLGRNVWGQGRRLSGALCTELQERKQLRQVDEPLGFAPLVECQLLTAVLAIEQSVKTLVNAAREPEEIEILRQLELEENLLGHADLLGGGRPGHHSNGP